MKSCERLHLTEQQMVELTGLTDRLTGAVAHLRDAWDMADEPNSRAIVSALAILFADSPGVQEDHEAFRNVLGSTKLAVAVRGAMLARARTRMAGSAGTRS